MYAWQPIITAFQKANPGTVWTPEALPSWGTFDTVEHATQDAIASGWAVTDVEVVALCR